jgi:hypothetical protein
MEASECHFLDPFQENLACSSKNNAFVPKMYSKKLTTKPKNAILCLLAQIGQKQK